MDTGNIQLFVSDFRVIGCLKFERKQHVVLVLVPVKCWVEKPPEKVSGCGQLRELAGSS